MDSSDLTIVDTKKIKKSKKSSDNREEFKISLTIIDGPEANFGKIYPFFTDTISIGRDGRNDLVINDIKVSKFHCKIKVKQNDTGPYIELEDLNSTNGTYINDQLVEQSFLNSGDKIELGDLTLRFTVNDEVEEKFHSKLFNFATTDVVTSLYNKRFIMNELDNQIKIAKRNKRHFSIMLLDIDDFKKLNDDFGHLAGDAYLKTTAFHLTQSLREQDLAGRFGGEEFLVLLPETDIRGAVKLAERIRNAIFNAELVYEKQTIKATISIGIAQYDGETPSSLINNADKELYNAKTNGKNRISHA